MKNDKPMLVTLGWDMKPTTTKGDGMVLPRKAEDILRSRYYPNGSGTWPIDPETGEKLIQENVWESMQRAQRKETSLWYRIKSIIKNIAGAEKLKE